MERSVFDLNKNEVGIIKSFKDSRIACTLLTIGLIPETRITLMKKSPFGGAVCLKLGDTFVAIRNSEAKNIIIE